MKEKDLKDLLKILKYVKENNLKEAQTLEDYINSSMKPHLLKYFKDKSKNKLIQSYVTNRYKEFYSINNDDLESRVAKILGVSLRELAKFSSIEAFELNIIKRDYKAQRQKDNSGRENQDEDTIEWIELLRENITIGLLSDYRYVRSLSEYIQDGQFDKSL
jgi:hypothetical protein